MTRATVFCVRDVLVICHGKSKIQRTYIRNLCQTPSTPALSCDSAFIFSQLYLKPAIHSCYSGTLFQMFFGCLFLRGFAVSTAPSVCSANYVIIYSQCVCKPVTICTLLEMPEICCILKYRSNFTFLLDIMQIRTV